MNNICKILIILFCGLGNSFGSDLFLDSAGSHYPISESAAVELILSGEKNNYNFSDLTITEYIDGYSGERDSSFSTANSQKLKDAQKIYDAREEIVAKRKFNALITTIIVLYFMPTIIAMSRKSVSKKKAWIIFFVNCFSGWTFMLYIISAVWAVSDFELK